MWVLFKIRDSQSFTTLDGDNDDRDDDDGVRLRRCRDYVYSAPLKYVAKDNLLGCCQTRKRL